MICFGEIMGFFFLMIRRPPRSTQSRSSAASDVYKRQARIEHDALAALETDGDAVGLDGAEHDRQIAGVLVLSLIHISEPTRLLSISYAVFCLKKKKQTSDTHMKTNTQCMSYVTLYST